MLKCSSATDKLAILFGMADDPTPKRRTWLNWLRFTAAYFCLVLCIGFVVLWVQSYFLFDELVGKIYGTEVFSVMNRQGEFELGRLSFDEQELDEGKVQWGWFVLPRAEVTARDA